MIAELIENIEEGQTRRNAYSSIEGYFYQFDLALYHILIDGTVEDPFGDNEQNQNRKFMIERIEDYSKILENDINSQIRIAQVKYHPGSEGESIYNQAILWMYYDYLKYLHSKQNLGLIHDLDYKAKLFFYDPSNQNYDVEQVLQRAWNKGTTNDTCREAKIINRINALPAGMNDNLGNRAAFINHTSFFRIEHDRQALIERIKTILPAIFTNEPNVDFLYGALISKIVDDGKRRIYITRNSLIEYINATELIESRVIKELIIESVYYLCIKKLSNEVSVFDNHDMVMTDKYTQIGIKIWNFMKNEFENSVYRKSFINTIIPDEINDFVSNTRQEWETFLKCEKQVYDFISRLAKIIYAYQIVNKVDVDLEKWIIVNDTAWIFDYPDDERGIGILLSKNVSDNYYLSIANISRKYFKSEIVPDVWYYCRNEDIDIRREYLLEYGKDVFSYKIDITKPDSKKVAPNSPSDKTFWLECMSCLMIHDYERVERVCRIFKKGCEFNEE